MRKDQKRLVTQSPTAPTTRQGRSLTIPYIHVGDIDAVVAMTMNGLESNCSLIIIVGVTIEEAQAFESRLEPISALAGFGVNVGVRGSLPDVVTVTKTQPSRGGTIDGLFLAGMLEGATEEGQVRTIGEVIRWWNVIGNQELAFRKYREACKRFDLNPSLDG